jgi:hypothetical protein
MKERVGVFVRIRQRGPVVGWKPPGMQPPKFTPERRAERETREGLSA